MSKTEKLLIECKSRNLHCSITYQRINDYSVEIYTGYKERYQKHYYTDGHIRVKKAVKAALKYLKTYESF